MIKIQKQQNIVAAQPSTQVKNQMASTTSTSIRAASVTELTKYEKNKLAGIEAQAQQNKIEAIRINGKKIKPDENTKTVNINVGDLAFKSTVTSSEIDSNELFFIKCSLN